MSMTKSIITKQTADRLVKIGQIKATHTTHDSGATYQAYQDYKHQCVRFVRLGAGDLRPVKQPNTGDITASALEVIDAVSAITTHYERTKPDTARSRRHVSVARRLIASLKTTADGN